MEYPLKEKIGNPDLLVGREKEFKNFRLWIENIPGELSKSQVILARRKSGKIKKRLHLMVEADVLEWGASDIEFQGLRDGTLNLILQNRFEKEISTFEIMPDLRTEFQAQIDALK